MLHAMTTDGSNIPNVIVSRWGKWLPVKQQLLCEPESLRRNVDRLSIGSNSTKHGGRRATIIDQPTPRHHQYSLFSPEARSHAVGRSQPGVPSLSSPSLGDRPASSHPKMKLSLNILAAGARAISGRPQNSRGRASIDDQQRYPVDVTKLSPSLPESKIRAKLCRNTLQSSLSPPPLDDQPTSTLQLSSNRAATAHETRFQASVGLRAPKCESERRASRPQQPTLAEYVRRKISDDQTSSLNPDVLIESTTRLHSNRPRVHMGRRSSDMLRHKPTFGDRQVSLNEKASRSQSTVNRPASAIEAEEELLHLVARMRAKCLTDRRKSSSGAEEKEYSNIGSFNIHSSSDVKSPSALKPTNRRSSTPFRSSRRESLSDRPLSPYPQLSLDMLGVEARIGRPHRRLSVPSPNNYRRASLYDQKASPADVSQFSRSRSGPTVYAQLRHPTTRRSSLPPLPFVEQPASTPALSFKREKPPRNHIGRRSSDVFPCRPSDDRRMRINDAASRQQSRINNPVSALAEAEDLLVRIANTTNKCTKKICRVPVVVTRMNDNDAISDISSSEVGDDNDCDDSLFESGWKITSEVKGDNDSNNSLSVSGAGLGTFGHDKMFWNEAWYALD